MPFAEKVQSQAQEQEAVAETQEGEMDAAMKAMMEKFSDYSIPGEQHQVLSPLIGTWKQKVKYWMSPNDEAQESKDIEGVGDHKYFPLKVGCKILNINSFFSRNCTILTADFLNSIITSLCKTFTIKPFKPGIAL